jgi:tetratricopeptide (TPR) repeat protein
MTAIRAWTGREARALRAAMRLSIRDFAEYLGVGVRTVTKWQARGEDLNLRPAMQSVLDAAFDRATPEIRERFELIVSADDPHVTGPVASDSLAAPGLGVDTWHRCDTEALAAFLRTGPPVEPGAANEFAHEWRVVDPPQMVEMVSGRRVGERLAQLIVERVDMLRRMDDFLGGGDLHDLVARELRVTLDLVREASYTEPVGRVLLGAVGELCQLAGWVATDAGLNERAERYYLGGVTAAHAAGDAPLAAHLLSSLAYQMANVGDAREAALLASTAWHGAEAVATAATRALLLDRLAWAYARLGDAEAAEQAIDRASEAIDDSEAGGDPSWAYWVNIDEVDIMAGRCFTELRQPKRAIALLEASIARYDEGHARDLALYLSWLAEAHVHAGNVDQAATVALHALRLTASVASDRNSKRLNAVGEALMAHQGHRGVNAFLDETRSLGVISTAHPSSRPRQPEV